MLKTVDGADEIKIRHPSRKNNRFLQAQASRDFIQWINDNAREYVRRILVFVPR